MFIFEVLLQKLKCLHCIHVNQAAEVCHDATSECAFSAAGFWISHGLLGCEEIKHVLNPHEDLVNFALITGILLALHAVYQQLQTLHIVLPLFQQLNFQVVEFGVLGLDEEKIDLELLKRLAEVHQFDQSILAHEEVLALVDLRSYAPAMHGSHDEILVQLQELRGVVKQL